MFYTTPSAEIPTPAELAPHGERTWQWIELGLNIPMFLAHYKDPEQHCTRHIWLSRFEDLLSLATQGQSEQRLLAIGLLSPDYMNNSENYQLNWVTSIWRDRGDPRVFKYRCQNGVILVNDFFGLEKLASKSREFECVLALYPEVQ